MHKFSLCFVIGMALLSGLTYQAEAVDVTNPADDGVTTTIPGTLRYAVAYVNAGSDNMINFALSNSITVFNRLDITANGVWVIGYSNTIGAISPGIDIFHLNGDTCNFSGLALINSNNALVINGQNCTVLGCWIGTDGNSTANIGNRYGIVVNGLYAAIGLTGAISRNIISGNTFAGIQVNANASARIKNNYIGTSVDGMNSLYNGAGIIINRGLSCQVGGDISNGEGNLISGNSGYGINCTDTIGTTICGNVIGLNATQTAAIPNNTGIRISSDGIYPSNSNWIGLPLANKYNVIAGNWYNSTPYNILIDASNANIIQNNYIGVNASGTALGVRSHGIYFSNPCYGNFVGGNRASGLTQRNVISGGANGIVLNQGGGNTICGNYIGTNPGGSAGVGNNIGMVVCCNNNLIGGRNLDAGTILGNVISGNITYGLELNAASGNSIVGNFMGLSGDGMTQLNNGSDAIYMQNADGNLIGGASDQAKNLVVGNASSSGIHLVGNSTGSLGNTMVGNWIGVMADGSLSAVKLSNGIYLEGSSAEVRNNLIGDKSIGAANLIANTANGIQVSGGSLAYSNGFFGNTICGFSIWGINLLTTSNASKQPPTILSAISGVVSGQSQNNNYIEVFLADRASGRGGSLKFLGAATADNSGVWSASVSGVSNGAAVSALATDGNSNTSYFAVNHYYGPSPTSTITPTSTPTITSTPTCTPSLQTPTASQTPTFLATSSPTCPSSWGQDQDYGLVFPNPAKDHAVFVVQPSAPALIRIEIFNANAERVAVLAQSLPAGKGQMLTWACKPIAPGIYLARILADGKEMKKVKFAVVH